MSEQQSDALEYHREAVDRSVLSFLIDMWSEVGRPAYTYHSKVGALFLVLPRAADEVRRTALTKRPRGLDDCNYLYQIEDCLSNLFESGRYTDKYGHVYLTNGPNSDLRFAPGRRSYTSLEPTPVGILIEGLASVESVSRAQFSKMCDTTKIQSGSRHSIGS